MRTRAHHKATAVQPWDAADDGTEKWEPEWTSRERRHLRAIRSPPDSLRPLTSPYRVPSPGEPVSSGQGSSSPEVTPESAQDLAEHIGAFLRSLDTGGDFRGQGLEDQKIYIGGAPCPLFLLNLAGPNELTRRETLLTVQASPPRASPSTRSRTRPAVRRHVPSSKSSSTSKASGEQATSIASSIAFSCCPGASWTRNRPTSARSTEVRKSPPLPLYCLSPRALS